MKKMLQIIIIGSLMLLIVTAVSASGPRAAFVIQNETCWVPDGTGSLEFDDLWVIPDCCIVVESNSNSGFKKFSCNAQLPAEAVFPDRAMTLTYESTDGFECWWDDAGTITTQDYLFTITPSGKVNFHCMFKN